MQPYIWICQFSVELIDANNIHANIIHANIMYANIIYANIIYANFIYANIIYANFIYASIIYANVIYANSIYANSIYANSWMLVIPELLRFCFHKAWWVMMFGIGYYFHDFSVIVKSLLFWCTIDFSNSSLLSGIRIRDDPN